MTPKEKVPCCLAQAGQSGASLSVDARHHCRIVCERCHRVTPEMLSEIVKCSHYCLKLEFVDVTNSVAVRSSHGDRQSLPKGLKERLR